MSSSEDLTASQSGFDTDEEPSSAEEQESENEASQGSWAQVSEEERQGVPQREEDKPFIDNDQLILLVKEREALWDTRDYRHSDLGLIRRLWEEVAGSLLADWDLATPQDRKDFLKRVKVRWRSMKDRFNKDIRQEIRVRSGAAPKVSKYKYHRMLSFLRPALAQRTTWSSTTEPGSSSVVAAPHQPANEQSQSSTSDGEQEAVSPSGFPLFHPSAPGFVGSAPQQQSAWERSFLPEFTHLSSVFHDGMRAFVDRLDRGLTQVQRRLDCLEAALQSPLQHFFSTIERGMSENLPPDLQLYVMNACQDAFRQAMQQGPAPLHTSQGVGYTSAQQLMTAQVNYPPLPPLDITAVPPVPSHTTLQSAAPLQHAATRHAHCVWLVSRKFYWKSIVRIPKFSWKYRMHAHKQHKRMQKRIQTHAHAFLASCVS
ncbi:uncharacterized protein LOC143765748 [Ranitomeya variabilis]|uniref:uncharacterized protein LOC143765748 n=1 Tax=Ranitomeya variabilis TaxID=490064 RepID=UPI0040574CBF